MRGFFPLSLAAHVWWLSRAFPDKLRGMGSFCSYFDRALCRSCEWLDRDYAAQLAAKSRSLRSALRWIQDTDYDAAIREPAPSATQGFRNRAKMSVTGTSDAPVIGLLGEIDLDEGRELLSCPIHHPRLNQLIEALPEFLRCHGLVPYQIKARKGELKGLIAFYSPMSGQMYLRFVLRSKESLPRLRKLLPELQVRFPDLLCVSANLQPIPHAILEGPEEIVLSERGWIEHRLGPVTLQLVPQAFVQTNVSVATALYQAAAEWIEETRPKAMLELYCGQGAFSLFAAKSAERIVGIEVNADAVRIANDTARSRGLGHVSFRCSDATQLAEEVEQIHPDLILANPPRRGLGEGVDLILRQRPVHFIYSSCNSETLAHDLEKLAPLYQVKRIQIFDMFPHTRHFETLVWALRR